jgi:hypothetical protein
LTGDTPGMLFGHEHACYLLVDYLGEW